MITTNLNELFGQNGLIEESNSTVQFVIINMVFYILNIGVNLWSLRKINRENGRYIVRYNFILTLFIWIFSCWGLEEVYSLEMTRLVDKYEKDGSHKYKDVYYMLILMVWIRLAFVVILLLSSIIVIIVYCCLSCCGLLPNDRHEDRVNRRLQRLPGVKSFLNQQARKFNPDVNVDDKDLIECAICLEEFKSDPEKKIS